MNFLRTIDIYIDVDAYGTTPILTYNSGQAVANSNNLSWVASDVVTLNLHFMRLDSTWEAQRLVGSTIILAGKSTPDGEALFACTSFTEASASEGYYYYDTLSLHTTALSAAMGTSDSLEVHVDLELQDATNTYRQTFQWDVDILKQYYLGTEGLPASAAIIYPAPGSLLLNYTGTVEPTAKQFTVDITGFALDAAPKVFLQVESESCVFAIVKKDTISNISFEGELSSYDVADGTKVLYFLIP